MIRFQLAFGPFFENCLSSYSNNLFNNLFLKALHSQLAPIALTNTLPPTRSHYGNPILKRSANFFYWGFRRTKSFPSKAAGGSDKLSHGGTSFELNENFISSSEPPVKLIGTLMYSTTSFLSQSKAPTL